MGKKTSEPDPGPVTKKKPVYKKIWFWLIVVAIAAVTVGNRLEKRRENDSAPKQISEEQGQKSRTGSNEDTPQDKQTETDETPKQQQSTVLAIGDTATLQNWEITVTDFYLTTKIDGDYSAYYSPDEGNQYAVVAVSAANKGKESDVFLPTYSLTNDIRAKIYYQEEYEYSPTNILGYRQDMHDSSMNPLTTKEGIIAFSLPNLVADSSDALLLTFSCSNEKATFSLR